jgi:hypothetical protein
MWPALKVFEYGWKGEKAIHGWKNTEAAPNHKIIFVFYNYRVSIKGVNR